MAAQSDENGQDTDDGVASGQDDSGHDRAEKDEQDAAESLSEKYDVEGLETDVFETVYGHDGAKAVTAAALRSGDVHVLYEGPSGSGKSVMLMALEDRVPGVIYRDGDQITASKLRDVLKSDPPILLIDEIDALDNEAYDVLSIPMEHGRLVRDSAREEYDVTVGTQIVGACNDADALPPHIKNRFRVLQLEPYSESDYVELCGKMLPSSVDWIDTEQEGRQAAKKVLEITGRPDPRDARDISRMSRSLDEIDVLSKAMHDPEAEMEVGPLFPGEIARAQGEVGKVHLRRIMADDIMERSKRAQSDDDPDAEPAEKSEVESEIEQAVEEAIT